MKKAIHTPMPWNRQIWIDVVICRRCLHVMDGAITHPAWWWAGAAVVAGLTVVLAVLGIVVSLLMSSAVAPAFYLPMGLTWILSVWALSASITHIRKPSERMAGICQACGHSHSAEQGHKAHLGVAKYENNRWALSDQTLRRLGLGEVADAIAAGQVQ